jgi:hypothetical protein
MSAFENALPLPFFTSLSCRIWYAPPVAKQLVTANPAFRKV